MTRRKHFKPTDLIIPAAALVLAAFIYFAGYNTEKTGTALIIIDGETVETIDLATAQNEILFFGDVTVEIRNSTIAIVDSPCFGKDCVKTGFISKPGEMSVCLPEKTLIKISGTDKNAPDVISF